MISITKTSAGPLYLQIYNQLRQDIASGTLAEGAIPDLLGEALVAAHDGRLVRSEDGFLVTLAASAP